MRYRSYPQSEIEESEIEESYVPPFRQISRSDNEELERPKFGRFRPQDSEESDDGMRNLTFRFEQLPAENTAPPPAKYSHRDMKTYLVPHKMTEQQFTTLLSFHPIEEIFKKYYLDKLPVDTGRRDIAHPARVPGNVPSDSGSGRRGTGARRARDMDPPGQVIYGQRIQPSKYPELSAMERMAYLKAELDKIQKKPMTDSAWSFSNLFTGWGNLFSRKEDSSKKHSSSRQAGRTASYRREDSMPDVISIPPFSGGRDQGDRDPPRSDRRTIGRDAWNYVSKYGLNSKTFKKVIESQMLLNMGNGIQRMGNTLGDFYETYEELPLAMNWTIMQMIVGFIFTLLSGVYGFWLICFSEYIPLELAKTVTLTFIISFMAYWRISSRYLFVAGLFACLVMYQVQHDPYVHIRNDQFSNCRVYQAIDKCMRQKKQVIMSGFFLLTEVTRHCLLDVDSSMCRQARVNANDALEVFHECAKQTVSNRKLVESQPVYLKLYRGAKVDSGLTITHKSITDSHSSEMERIHNLYYLLAFRLDEGFFWENHNRMELARENFKNATGDMLSKSLDFLRMYLSIGMPDGLTKSLLMAGLVKDVVSHFTSIEPSKIDIFEYLQRNNHRRSNEELHRIQERQVDRIKVQVHLSLGTPSVMANLALSKQNLTRRAIYHKNETYIGEAYVPEKRRMGQATPVDDEQVDENSCDDVTKLQNLTWDFRRCPLLPQVFVTAAELQFDTKTPSFCPTYCSITVFESSKQDLMTESLNMIQKLRNDISDCQKNNEDLTGDHQFKIERLKNEYKELLDAAKQKCQDAVCQKEPEYHQDNPFTVAKKTEEVFIKIEQELDEASEKILKAPQNSMERYVFVSIALFGLCLLAQIYLCCCRGESTGDNDDGKSTRTTDSTRAEVLKYPSDNQEQVKKWVKAIKKIEREKVRQSERIANKRGWLPLYR